jgi:hypothetical protein
MKKVRAVLLCCALVCLLLARQCVLQTQWLLPEWC